MEVASVVLVGPVAVLAWVAGVGVDAGAVLMVVVVAVDSVLKIDVSRNMITDYNQ